MKKEKNVGPRGQHVEVVDFFHDLPTKQSPRPRLPLRPVLDGVDDFTTLFLSILFLLSYFLHYF